MLYSTASGVHFSLTLTLGEVLQMATMAVCITAVIVQVKTQLSEMKDNLSHLAARVERHEQTLFSMFGELQRIIGAVETRRPH